jgi:hypothetical protein
LGCRFSIEDLSSAALQDRRTPRPNASRQRLRRRIHAGKRVNATNGTQADQPTGNTTGLTNSGRLFDRQAWGGLTTPLGEFRVGRQNTGIFYIGNYIDLAPAGSGMANRPSSRCSRSGTRRY